MENSPTHTNRQEEDSSESIKEKDNSVNAENGNEDPNKSETVIETVLNHENSAKMNHDNSTLESDNVVVSDCKDETKENQDDLKDKECNPENKISDVQKNDLGITSNGKCSGKKEDLINTKNEDKDLDKSEIINKTNLNSESLFKMDIDFSRLDSNIGVVSDCDKKTEENEDNLKDKECSSENEIPDIQENGMCSETKKDDLVNIMNGSKDTDESEVVNETSLNNESSAEMDIDCTLQPQNIINDQEEEAKENEDNLKDKECNSGIPDVQENGLEKTANNKCSEIKKAEKSSEPIINIRRPLCADYRSDSDSYDSESDSSGSSSSSSDSDDDIEIVGEIRKKMKRKEPKVKDLSLADLPPIEDLKISVPENECQELGVITSIVDTLVVIESFKGNPALDIDTVLFLDKGTKTLGKIFDVLGPVSEPVYTVRFSNCDQIEQKKIQKGLKVYCAPRTEHTSFVFLSELMKMKGSDASWKDNIEAPPEFQDFSDDEEEQRSKKIHNEARNENNRRKCNENSNRSSQETGQKRMKSWTRPASRPAGKYLNPSRFPSPQFQRPINSMQCNSWSYPVHAVPSQNPKFNPSFNPMNVNPFVIPPPPSFPQYNPPAFRAPAFPNVPPFPGNNFIVNAVLPPPPPPPQQQTTQAASQSHVLGYSRSTGPPPFNAFLSPPPTNRMPVPPFSFNQNPQYLQRYPQYQQQLPQPQFNGNANVGTIRTKAPTPMARTFGSDTPGPSTK